MSGGSSIGVRLPEPLASVIRARGVSASVRAALVLWVSAGMPAESDCETLGAALKTAKIVREVHLGSE